MRRIANLISTVTRSTWLHVTCGLFERHKLIFSLMLAYSVAARTGKVGFGPFLGCCSDKLD